MKRLWLILFLPALALAVYDTEWFDLNNWLCPFHNDGRWGIDTSRTPNIAGGCWPQPLHNAYIFGAGPWVGALSQAETLVTYGYNPNSGRTEMTPVLCRYWREGTSDPRDRIYRYPGDWPPPPDRFPMAPQTPRSDMDLWCCFGDSDPAKHDTTGGQGRPLGIDIYLTVYGYADSIARDFFFLRYKLNNYSGQALSGVYFGIVVDADVGDGTDDMTGLILNQVFHVGSDTFRVTNTGFALDNNNNEAAGRDWESGTPGAVAVRLLQAPAGLGLTAFKKHTIDIDPITDASQYMTMAGYDWRTGVYSPFDSVDLSPGDKRFLLASGPFDLAADSTATFWYAVIGTPYGEANQMPWDRDTSDLALRCWWAERTFQRLLAVEEPGQEPRPPSVSIYPNPFSPAAPLRIQPAGVAGATAEVYDTGGRLVRTLAGQSLVWDGSDSQGRILPAGVYFVRPGTSDKSKTCKVLFQH
jgi:hypothetical protein